MQVEAASYMCRHVWNLPLIKLMTCQWPFSEIEFELYFTPVAAEVQFSLLLKKLLSLVAVICHSFL